MTGGPTIELAPVGEAELPEVGEFLHTHLNQRLTGEQWARSLRPAWQVDAPNHGFCLREGGTIVGVQAAFYSERTVGGHRERFCNLAAWCVLPEHRSQGLRLLRAVLAQRGYHFTDFSPSGAVVEVNRRLRFEDLDTATVLVPHLPLPRVSRGGIRVLEGVDVVAPRLAGTQRQLLEDHRVATAVLHLLLVRGDQQCYVMARRDRRKGLPVFTSLLHVSDPDLLHQGFGRLGSHLLRRHRVAATLAELRVVGTPPRHSFTLASPRPKMFRPERGRTLSPVAVDSLYSELTCVAW